MLKQGIENQSAIKAMSEKSDGELIGILTKRINELELAGYGLKAEVCQLSNICRYLVEAIKKSKGIDSGRSNLLNEAVKLLEEMDEPYPFT